MTPIYRIKIVYACPGWLNLPVGKVFEAQRCVGWFDSYWHIPELNKDVPEYAARTCEEG